MQLNGIKKILIVEDYENFRKVLSDILKDAFPEVDFLEAENGSEALLALEKHEQEIGIIITDIEMPIVGGFELLKRAVPNYPGIKFLVMTGYNIPEYKSAAMSLGAKAFLQKCSALNDYEVFVQTVQGLAYS